MKRFFLSLLMVVVLGSSSWAANYWLLTDLGSSAQMIGIGGIEGFGDSANSVFENPASLSRVNSASLSAFTTTILGEITYTNFALANKFSFGTIGIGYMDASVGGISHTGQNTDSIGTHFSVYQFDYKNTIMKLSYEKSVTKTWFVGASLSQYRMAFDDVNGGVTNFDVGTLYDYGPATFSFSIRNFVVGKKIEFGRNDLGHVLEELLPFQTTFGLQYRMGQIDSYLQFKDNGTTNMISLGTCYRLETYPISISAGYKQFQVLDKTKDTLVFGLGLILEDMSFHYAFEKSSHLDFDNKNYFSMTVKF
ncbi:MAG: hypothetical protein EXS67_05905 [Candidatus Margulisbacteria bacterium]|nr:hypothetical protein [Candidatus Margulisiibacteriota bacterium]